MRSRDPRTQSGARLAAHNLNVNGGFSVDLEGAVPAPGVFMVSHPGEEAIPSPASPLSIAQFARGRAGGMGENDFVGGWRDEDRDVLDISEAHADGGSAALAGWERDQDAIFETSEDGGTVHDRSTYGPLVARSLNKGGHG